MITQSGIVSSCMVAPHVYFITKYKYLYIGETYKNPVGRWGSHISNEGSFKTKLEAIDQEVWDINLPISFYAYRCIDAPCNSIAENRTFFRFVEDQIHRLAILDPFLFQGYTIISSTNSTAPRGYSSGIGQEIAKKILEMFISDLTSRE